MKQLQFFKQLGLVNRLQGVVQHVLGRVQDGAVACAAAQVARQGLQRVFTGHGAWRGVQFCRFGQTGLVQRKQAHGKARCAKPTLAGMVLHQCLLHGVWPLAGCQVVHRPQGLALHRVGQLDATVHGPVVELAVGSGLRQHDGAGTAVAAAATFLGAGQPQVVAQQVQQGAARWYIAQPLYPAVADELQRRGAGRLG